MNIIVVRSQIEWDALPRSFEDATVIEVRSNAPIVINSNPGSSRAVLHGSIGAVSRDGRALLSERWMRIYAYPTIPHITFDGEKRIVMGCRNHSLAEWESNEWNNDSEFPNDGSEKSKLRHFALETAKKWLEEFGYD